MLGQYFENVTCDSIHFEKDINDEAFEKNKYG